MQKSKLRVGLVGCGFISYWLLRAWQEIERVQVVALCDVNQQAARRRSREFGVSRVYTDFQKMVSQEQLDIVDIATGMEVHKPLSLTAVEHGSHVICQKPLAPSLLEAKQIVNSCTTHGVKLMIHQNFRWQPWFVKIKELLDCGAIGTPYSASIVQYLDCVLPHGIQGEVPLTTNQPKYATVPRLLLMEMGAHYVDLYRSWFGEATTVYAELRHISPHVAGEDMALLVLRFGGGLVGLINDNWCAVGQDINNRTIIYGEKGSILFPGTSGPLSKFTRDVSLELVSADGSQCFYSFGKDNHFLRSFIETQKHFVECIFKDKVPATCGTDNLRSLAIIHSAYESAQTHSVVTIKNLKSLKKPIYETMDVGQVKGR